jgi:hypothetical protein
MANGEINNHEGEYIGVDSLVGFLQASLPWTGADPSFGLCWNSAGGCTARLYPEEVQPFIPADLYTTYKDNFNRAFQTMAGGGKRKMVFRQQTRKLRRSRKQRGGSDENGFGNIFVEAEDAKCYLPSMKKADPTPNKPSKRKGRKTRKMNRSG